jgi:hypothetical protein
VQKIKKNNDHVSGSHDASNMSLRSVLAYSEYFMLKQCLENRSEGWLNACISSIKGAALEQALPSNKRDIKNLKSPRRLNE